MTAGDDRVRIEYRLEEGPRGEVTLEIPRVVDAQTGETLLSFWGSWFTGPIEWEAPGLLRMRMMRVASGGIITIDIDLDARTYRVLHEDLTSEFDREFIRKALAASPLHRAPRLAVDAPPVSAGHVLAGVVGAWSGAYRLWLEPGSLRTDCVSSLRAVPVLDGRFVSVEYTWTVDDEAQRGQMLLGPGPQMAWIDPWHNGDSIMFCSAVAAGAAEAGAEAEGFVVQGSYGPPERPWGWRTTVDVPEPDVLVVTMWNVSPDGEENKAVEAAYTR